jgi:hypothetical protein
VLSIERTRAAVVACYASPKALDSLPVIPGTRDCRVAPDEMLLVSSPAHLAEIERRAAEHLAAAEPDALILDQSDGWSVFTLRGDEAPFVFAQLSAVPLPIGGQAFLQGAVAGGSAKILLFDDGIHVLVPSTLRHHLAARLKDVCGGRAMVPDAETAFAGDTPSRSYQDGAIAPALR